MNKYSFITPQEFRSLLYYQGAVPNIELKAEDASLEEFYQINNAYETINMLLFPGIENEKARLYVEKRQIDEDIFDDIEELLNTYYWLYSAMCKYMLYTTDGKTMHTRRDDRRHTYLCMQSGENNSFLSTSLNLQSAEYFQKKDGLVLMEFLAEDTVEHINMNDVLGSKSAYPNENEILYSPFLYLTIDSLPLNKDEKTFLDYHQEPPYGKYLITLKGSTINPKKPTKEDKEWLSRQSKRLIATKEIENIKKVWNAIKTNTEDNYQNEIDQYIIWKQNLRVYLREMYSIIKYEQKTLWENKRADIFIKDLTRRPAMLENNGVCYSDEKYQIGKLIVDDKEIGAFTECPKIVFDEDTFNFHIFPQNPEIFKQVSECVSEKREKILEYMKKDDRFKLTESERVAKKESKNNSNKIFYYAGTGSRGSIKKLSCFKQYSNDLYKFISVYSKGVNYNLNFMKFDVDKKKINCELKKIQFDRTVYKHINIGKKGIFKIGYKPIDMKKQESGVAELEIDWNSEEKDILDDFLKFINSFSLDE